LFDKNYKNYMLQSLSAFFKELQPIMYIVVANNEYTFA
jgi:hypothetical protein